MNLIRYDIDQDLVKRIKKKYFFDTQKMVFLKAGETLLKQDQPNKRLFLVLSGQVVGISTLNGESQQELFRAGKNKFVGMHSFFSKSYKAFSDVVATEDTQLTYMNADDFKEPEYYLTDDFAPILVSELYTRQLISNEIAQEKEAALKKLHQKDKMATLGQMAAGLAHELNNAIGVINGNSEWIAKEVYEHFKISENSTNLSLFERGFEKGQYNSSNQVRELKRLFEKLYDLSPSTAKKLAKIGFDEKSVLALLKDESIDEQCEKMHQSWELGVALHDIIQTSRHAVHVLKSVKQLSVSDYERNELDVNDTIREALTLLHNLVKKVEVDFKINDLKPLIANQGELVQIWVNIIKNACESMLNAKTENASLIIETKCKKNSIWVNITDNGPGIPNELNKKIFQPNFTTKKGGLSFGLGLGLSIVQRLVESYNGKIDVSSKKGQTSFSIIIPIN